MVPREGSLRAFDRITVRVKRGNGARKGGGEQNTVLPCPCLSGGDEKNDINQAARIVIDSCFCLPELFFLP